MQMYIAHMFAFIRILVLYWVGFTFIVLIFAGISREIKYLDIIVTQKFYGVRLCWSLMYAFNDFNCGQF